jgi:hypothetical protein
VLNVSIDRPLWNCLGNDQTKLTRSFHPRFWTSEDGDGPRHDDATREALAEAVALVTHGRGSTPRQQLARIMASEPAFSKPSLRRLVTQLHRARS